MDLPPRTTDESPFEKAKYKWEHGYQVSDDAFDLVMKELDELATAIYYIKEQRYTLRTRFQKIYDTRNVESMLSFQVNTLIKEGDFIMSQREDLYNWALRINNSDLIQDMKKSCKK
jgi:hypothetical protein